MALNDQGFITGSVQALDTQRLPGGSTPSSLFDSTSKALSGQKFVAVPEKDYDLFAKSFDPLIVDKKEVQPLQALFFNLKTGKAREYDNPSQIFVQPEYFLLNKNAQNGVESLVQGKIKADLGSYQSQVENQSLYDKISDALAGGFAGLATSASPFVQGIKNAIPGVPFERSYNVQNDSQAYKSNPYFRTGADIGNISGGISNFIASSTVPGGLAGYSAASNAQRLAEGDQNLGQAVFNTGADLFLGSKAASNLFNKIPIANQIPNPRLRAAAASLPFTAATVPFLDAANSLLAGQKINQGDILRNTIDQGLINAVLAGALHGRAPAARNENQSVPGNINPVPEQAPSPQKPVKTIKGGISANQNDLASQLLNIKLKSAFLPSESERSLEKIKYSNLKNEYSQRRVTKKQFELAERQSNQEIANRRKALLENPKAIKEINRSYKKALKEKNNKKQNQLDKFYDFIYGKGTPEVKAAISKQKNDHLSFLAKRKERKTSVEKKKIELQRKTESDRKDALNSLKAGIKIGNFPKPLTLQQEQSILNKLEDLSKDKNRKQSFSLIVSKLKSYSGMKVSSDPSILKAYTPEQQKAIFSQYEEILNKFLAENPKNSTTEKTKNRKNQEKDKVITSKDAPLPEKTPQSIKAQIEYNTKELKRYGYSVDSIPKTITQTSSGAGIPETINYETLKETDAYKALSDSEKEIIKTDAEAAKTRSLVLKKYFAELSGDTSTFLLKEISPLGRFKLTPGGDIISYAVNQDGYVRPYYVTESRPSEITQRPSYTINSEIIKGSEGKAKDAEISNIYFPAKTIKTEILLKRPIPGESIPTSERISRLIEFSKGKSVKELDKIIRKEDLTLDESKNVFEKSAQDKESLDEDAKEQTGYEDPC